MAGERPTEIKPDQTIGATPLTDWHIMSASVSRNAVLYTL